jgi:exopolysaccharide biosynthesis polyprenyl glycosylphosphotransferase
MHTVLRSFLRSSLLFAQRAFDAVCGLSLLLGVFAVANVGHTPNGLEDFLATRLTVKNGLLLCAFLGTWNGLFALLGAPRAVSGRDYLRQVMKIAAAATIGSCPLLLFLITSQSGAFTLSIILTFWVLATTAEIVGRTLLSVIAGRLARSMTPIKTLVVGSGPRAKQVLEQIIVRGEPDYEVLGFIDQCGGHRAAELAHRVLGGLEELEAFLACTAVDRVLIALPVRSCYEAIQRVVAVCERMGVEVEYPADVFELERAKAIPRLVVGMPAMRVTHVVQDYRLLVKRAVDVLGALVGLVMLSPILLATAILVKVSSPGPVLFSQLRYGFNRRQFRMFKFRTMIVDAEAQQSTLESRNEVDGPVFKIKDDPRITMVGKFLRKLSLDELPQLVNVLRGEMSLVGPRPLPLRDVTRFTEASLMRRFSVQPGLTCLWQINGRSDTSFGQWIKLDLEYIDRWSLALDFAILVKTIPVVLRGSGAA